MLAKVLTCAVVGLDGQLIEVEVDIASYGMPHFTIVGLPDAAVQEARERVRAAIKNSGLTFPMRRVACNLAPADLKREVAYLAKRTPYLIGRASAQFWNLQYRVSLRRGLRSWWRSRRMRGWRD